MQDCGKCNLVDLSVNKKNRPNGRFFILQLAQVFLEKLLPQPVVTIH